MKDASKNYLDHINDEDLDGNAKFKGGVNWSLGIHVYQRIFKFIPKMGK